MTTGQSSIQAQPAPSGGACKFDDRRRRKFKRACCCITFLLLINAFLLLHTAHSVGAIMWFMMNGSYTYDDTTYIFVPGGAKTLCNDLCIDMCLYKSVGCDLNSCLNTCNQQLIDDGNVDDFEPLPTQMMEEIPLDEGLVLIDDTDDTDDTIFYDDNYYDVPLDEGLVLVDTPQAPEYDIDSDAQSKLDKMQKGIEAAADKLRLLKQRYETNCAEDPTKPGCDLSKQAIMKYIDLLKQSITAYNSFAVSVNIDIQVQVWMVDVDQVTAEP